MMTGPKVATGTSRPTYVEVDLDQLKSNYRATERAVGGVGVIPVVKADAYGHGLTTVANLFSSLRPTALAVAFLEEGIALRQAGIADPILVMGGLDSRQLQDFLQFDLMMTVSSTEPVEPLAAAAGQVGKRAQVQVELDSGMGRMGVRPEQLVPLMDRLMARPEVIIRGFYSHFATADEIDPAMTNEQLAVFRRAASYLSTLDTSTPDLHMANSGAVLQHPGSYFDAVRPGLMLYGVYPTDDVARTVTVRPAMTWKSTVVLTKLQPARCPVSYGATWAPQHDTLIATIPMGYGDGYPRRVSNRAEVLIRGRRHPVVGRVCMDQLVVDVGSSAEVMVGDEVVVMGTQGAENITANEIANWSETIPYEILTGITARVPRRYLSRSARPAPNSACRAP